MFFISFKGSFSSIDDVSELNDLQNSMKDFATNNEMYLSGDIFWGMVLYANTEEDVALFLLVFADRIKIAIPLTVHSNTEFYAFKNYKKAAQFTYHLDVWNTRGKYIYKPLFSHIREKTFHNVKYYNCPHGNKITLYVSTEKDYDTILEYLNNNRKTFLYRITKKI
jgi:hypothetical protein